MADTVLGVKTRPRGIFDADLEFKDAGLVAASAAATVDGSAKIVDLGTGTFRGEMFLDVSAVEIASNDERYDILIQLSSSATFASTYVTAAQLQLGANEVLNGDQDSTTGRYKVVFDNEYDLTYYRYARVFTVVAGTIATGINYTAYCSKQEVL
jgi:hypothetical protein